MTAIIANNTQNSSPINELYHRLESMGFDTPFVRDYMLPEWWSDTLGGNPAARSMAEVYISRVIGIPLQFLRESSKLPPTLLTGKFRLKKNSDASVDSLQPAIMLSMALATVLAKTLEGMPDYTPVHSAHDIRQDILKKYTSIDLASLLDWSWKHGVAVAHLGHLPKGTKRLTGIATYPNDRPVIILAEKRDSPPWLAFHLAHELGHILKSHVHPGQALFDSAIDWSQRDSRHEEQESIEREEAEANEFALALLTGDPAIEIPEVHGADGEKLASLSKGYERSTGTNAGTYALIYGYGNDRMGAAQNAIKILGLQSGAHQQIVNMLKQYMPEDAPETLEAFLPLINNK